MGWRRLAALPWNVARAGGSEETRALGRGRRVFLGVILLVAATIRPAALGEQDVAAKTDEQPSAGKVVGVTSLRVIQEKEGPAVEILGTGPLTPEIHLLKEPTRLVIDLPNARIDKDQKKIEVQADEISALRANQFQRKPPVARVVVDLLAERPYKWEATGNRLVVHLGKSAAGVGQKNVQQKNSGQSPFESATVTSFTPAPLPVVNAVRAAGPLAVESDAGSVGAAFHAGADTAILHLSSGGEVHVCPGTLVTITPSANRHNLLLGLSTGAMEAHLELDASTDLVLTPDFRIALEGPGEFHFAFRTDNRGDTCVRALAGNTGAVTATELLGDGTYQVKATEQVVFRGGQVRRVDMNVPPECGCPAPRQDMERAASEVPTEVPTTGTERPAAMANAQTVAETSPASGVGREVAAANSQNEMHVQMTAPLVFRATGPPPGRAGNATAATEPAPTASMVASAPVVAPATRTGLTVELEQPKRNIFRRIGGWFRKIF